MIGVQKERGEDGARDEVAPRWMTNGVARVRICTRKRGDMGRVIRSREMRRGGVLESRTGGELGMSEVKVVMGSVETFGMLEQRGQIWGREKIITQFEDWLPGDGGCVGGAVWPVRPAILGGPRLFSGNKATLDSVSLRESRQLQVSTVT